MTQRQSSSPRNQAATPSRPRSFPAGPTERGGWVGVAANPASGRGKGRQAVERLSRALERSGIETRVSWTLDERASLVERAGADRACRCLVAAGGDGTVAALVNERPGVPITVLPAGTENLFARYFRIGRSPEALARTIASGRVRPLDLGLASGRRFALMAGLGFDADVVSRHHLARVGGTGRMRPTSRSAYVEPVLRSSLTYRFPPITIEVQDGDRAETLVGATAFVFNLPCYALGLPMAPAARGDDGLLDLVVFRNPGPFQALHYLWLVLRGIHLKRPDVIHRRVRKVAIGSNEAVPVQLDGDPGGVAHPGEPPWTFEVLPRAINVLAPEPIPSGSRVSA